MCVFVKFRSAARCDFSNNTLELDASLVMLKANAKTPKKLQKKQITHDNPQILLLHFWSCLCRPCAILYRNFFLHRIRGEHASTHGREAHEASLLWYQPGFSFFSIINTWITKKIC